MALLIPPCNIYNVDETGFNICQKSQKIVARKGKKSVGILTSAEKGKNITITCAAEPKFSRLFSPYQPTSCHFPFGWHHLRLLSRYLAVLQSLKFSRPFSPHQPTSCHFLFSRHRLCLLTRYLLFSLHHLHPTFQPTRKRLSVLLKSDHFQKLLLEKPQEEEKKDPPGF